MSLRAMRISRYVPRESHSVVSISFIASLLEVENIELFGQHHVTLWIDSQSVWRFSQRQWLRDSTNVAWIYWTDLKSDTAVKTTVAVCEYRGAPTAQPQDCLMNTETTSVSGTSTADTVQKWLNWPWLMKENGKPPFLLTLRANTNWCFLR